jgi:class 3 adenylate cyclase
VTASLRSFSRYATEEIVREVVASGREAMLSGARREVSVLFSDLRGFTGFAERIRPEEVVAILNDHFGLLVGSIARHGGFVVDFLGDAVFTVFGAPRPDTYHVQHAVTCAIEMQRARTAQNEQNRAHGWPPLEMGVGIDTGAAVVGNMGSPRRIKYGVVGNIVNVAARIETFTVGGQVLVSDAIRQALGDRLVVDGPFEAEGKGVGATRRSRSRPRYATSPCCTHPLRHGCAFSSASRSTGRPTRPGCIGSVPGVGRSSRTRRWRSLTLSRYSCRPPLGATRQRYWMAR